METDVVGEGRVETRLYEKGRQGLTWEGKGRFPNRPYKSGQRCRSPIFIVMTFGVEIMGSRLRGNNGGEGAREGRPYGDAGGKGRSP